MKLLLALFLVLTAASVQAKRRGVVHSTICSRSYTEGVVVKSMNGQKKMECFHISSLPDYYEVHTKGRCYGRTHTAGERIINREGKMVTECIRKSLLKGEYDIYVQHKCAPGYTLRGNVVGNNIFGFLTLTCISN